MTSSIRSVKTQKQLLFIYLIDIDSLQTKFYFTNIFFSTQTVNKSLPNDPEPSLCRPDNSNKVLHCSSWEFSFSRIRHSLLTLYTKASYRPSLTRISLERRASFQW
jgi:hypothetical protein